jgi:hypothetical protein
MIGMAEQETRTRLSDLVIDRRARLRLSLAALADRCIDPDTGEPEVKTGWLHRLERRLPVTPPGLPQLRALAAGLELPLREVQDAAGEQFLGITTTYDAGSDGRIRVLMTKAGALSRDDLDVLIAIADALPVRPDRSGEDAR